MVDLESLELLKLEILDRNLQHQLPPGLGPGLHTELELMEEDWHQIPADLQQYKDEDAAIKDDSDDDDEDASYYSL